MVRGVISIVFLMLAVQVPLHSIVPAFLGNVAHLSSRIWMKRLLQNERTHLLNSVNEFSRDDFPDPRNAQVLAVALVRYAEAFIGQHPAIPYVWMETTLESV